jgi:hypothetical protein
MTETMLRHSSLPMATFGLGFHHETIELGGSELGVFLGGSLPPQFPPFRAIFFESDY